jgi:hypothetical protein
MATLPAELEVDRLMNLIRGFGWEMTEKAITDEAITLKIKKEVATKEA